MTTLWNHDAQTYLSNHFTVPDSFFFLGKNLEPQNTKAMTEWDIPRVMSIEKPMFLDVFPFWRKSTRNCLSVGRSCPSKIHHVVLRRWARVGMDASSCTKGPSTLVAVLPGWSSWKWRMDGRLDGWPSKNRGGFPPKWMVKIMEKPIKHGMIWGAHPYFWKHPYVPFSKGGFSGFMLVFWWVKGVHVHIFGWNILNSWPEEQIILHHIWKSISASL